jgi:hypothetical protein
VEVDLDEVIDLDAEGVANDARQQPLATILNRHVDPVVPVPRNLDIEVARDREQRDPMTRRLDPGQHDRVGARPASAAPAPVAADQEDRLRRRLLREHHQRVARPPVQLRLHRPDDRRLRPGVELADDRRRLPVADAEERSHHQHEQAGRDQQDPAHSRRSVPACAT